MKRSAFEIIKLDFFYIYRGYEPTMRVWYRKSFFEIGFICILLVLILIPAVQKLIIQSAMWILAEPFQVWGGFKSVSMFDIVRNQVTCLKHFPL